MAARNMDDIAAVFRKLRFRKAWLGGLDEADVWKQLDMLQKEYRSAYEAQEIRYQALLAERDEQIAKLSGQSMPRRRPSGEGSHE